MLAETSAVNFVDASHVVMTTGKPQLKSGTIFSRISRKLTDDTNELLIVQMDFVALFCVSKKSGVLQF